MSRRTAASVAVACWLALVGAIALAAIDPARRTLSVAVIIAALIVGSSALAWLRRGQG